MTEQPSSEPSFQAYSREDMTSALFAQLVLQQSNMALMLMGKVPHPESGQLHQDIEAAQLFIDQLEMLETKTKGNLTKEETTLLKQTLMNLRLAFVQAVESPAPAKPPAEQSGSGVAQPAHPAEASGGPSSPTTEEEHRKKFSKKY